MITLEEFKIIPTVITGKKADKIREKYISRFIDTSTDHYNKYIAELKQFKDGQYYVGYLWDCLKRAERVTEKQILDEKLKNIFVYLFWDLHSSEMILIKDYWKFPKEAVLELQYKEILDGLKYLPEDLYIVNHEFSWTIIYTHEYDEQQTRFYYKST